MGGICFFSNVKENPELCPVNIWYLKCLYIEKYFALAFLKYKIKKWMHNYFWFTSIHWGKGEQGLARIMHSPQFLFG